VSLAVQRRRLRSGRSVLLVRLRLSEDVLSELGARIGGSVEIMRGVGADAGRVRLRKTNSQADGFRITRYGGGRRPGGQISLPMDLLAVQAADLVPTQSLPFRAEDDLLEITLPEGLQVVDKTAPGAPPGTTEANGSSSSHADEDKDSGQGIGS